MMEAEKSNKNIDKNYWWRIGLKIFAESSGWIAIPVIGALFLGKWLDDKYQTEPLYFLSITGIAFIISTIGIARLGMRYIREIEKGEKKERETKKEQER